MLLTCTMTRPTRLDRRSSACTATVGRGWLRHRSGAVSESSQRGLAASVRRISTCRFSAPTGSHAGRPGGLPAWEAAAVARCCSAQVGWSTLPWVGPCVALSQPTTTLKHPSPSGPDPTSRASTKTGAIHRNVPSLPSGDRLNFSQSMPICPEDPTDPFSDRPRRGTRRLRRCRTWATAAGRLPAFGRRGADPRRSTRISSPWSVTSPRCCGRATGRPAVPATADGCARLAPGRRCQAMRLGSHVSYRDATAGVLDVEARNAGRGNRNPLPVA